MACKAGMLVELEFKNILQAPWERPVKYINTLLLFFLLTWGLYEAIESSLNA